MELRHFRYFAAVARYLNYREASRRLHVAQPAISQTILDLEEEIGAKLFLRNKRNVRLTAAGTALLGEAESILKRTDEAKRLAQRAARGEVGILRIGFIAPATAPILPPLVQTYLSKYPDVELQLHHMNPDDQLAAFDEGTLDLGLSRPLPPERRPYLEEEGVYNDYRWAVLPPKHPLAKEKKIKLEKLASEPFVLLHRIGAPSLFDEAVAMCRRAGFSPKVRHEPDLIAESPRVGNPMNLSMVISVYASISRELGLPLRFPGTPNAYTALYQVTSADILARATEWATTSPSAANEIFNVTNGDYFRWINLWPAPARYFNLPCGDQLPLHLTEHMADKEPIWNRITERYGLEPISYSQIVSWGFGDPIFGTNYENISSTIKLRRAGFPDCIDTEEMFCTLFDQLRRKRIIP